MSTFDIFFNTDRMVKTCYRLFLSFQVWVTTYFTVLVCDLRVMVNIVTMFAVNSLQLYRGHCVSTAERGGMSG